MYFGMEGVSWNASIYLCGTVQRRIVKTAILEINSSFIECFAYFILPI